MGGFELPDQNAAAQRVLVVSKLLRELGLEVGLVGVSRSLASPVSIEDTHRVVDGFNTWAVPYPRSTTDWLQFVTSSVAIGDLVDNRYAGRLIGIICYNHPALAQAGVRRICRRNAIAHIADATEWYESSGGSATFRLLKWLDTTLRMRLIHVHADGVMATSPYLSRFYRQRGCRVVDVPTLCDAEGLARIQPLVRHKDPDTLYLVYAGSPFDVKRIGRGRDNLKDRLDEVVLLLGRMAELGYQFLLEICGITLENYLVAFPEHTDVLRKLSGKIVFLGRTGHAETLARIKSADFTVFLRRKSRVTLAGFPTKFSESVTAGTPVITNRLENIAPYLRDGVNGFDIDIDNRDAQVAKMAHILSLDRAILGTMRENCLRARDLDFRSFRSPMRAFLAGVTGVDL